MMEINFPVKCIIVFAMVCVIASVVSPFLDSPVTNISVKPHDEVLAETSYGNVTKEGPYGNASSPVKIAYVVGMHPWEEYAHVAASQAVKNHSQSLRYCYYIYRINVTGGIDSDYETGRMDGQILARDYVLPDIEKGNFQLVMDIHSNKGEEDYYDVSWFINVPYNDTRTNEIAQELLSKIPGLVSYDPPIASSPTYFTIPLIKNGTPAIIYEANAYDSPQTRQDRADKLLKAVDSLNLENQADQLA